MCGAQGDVRFVPIADVQRFMKKENPGTSPGLLKSRVRGVLFGLGGKVRQRSIT